ncbi:MAG: ABC transporter permease [Gemmatimonadota bacterium]
MAWIPDRYRDLIALLQRGRVEADIDEEFTHHLEQRIAENVAAGMSPEAARRAALERFGDVPRYRRQTRALDQAESRTSRWRDRLDLIRRELSRATRGIVKAPAFAAVAVATLALGFGTAAAIFTLVDAVVLRPLPYPDADRLVVIRHPVPKVSSDAVWGLSPGGYFYFRSHARTLDGLAAYQTFDMSIAGDGVAERVRAAATTPDLFSVLGARPVQGRLYTAADDPPARAGVMPTVVVLSYAFWQRRYGGDPHVIGTIIRPEGMSLEVLGVAEPGFALPEAKPDLWFPLGLDPNGIPHNEHYLRVIGRSRAGASVAAVQADLAGLTAEFAGAMPDAYGRGFMEQSGFETRVVPLQQHVVGAYGRVLWILLGAVGLVLLIAAANVANLFLVRAESTARHTAIRTALGAGRADLVLHHLSESLLIGATAGAVGLVVAYGSLRGLLALAPSDVPRLDQIAFSGHTVLFTAALVVLASVALGLFPMIHGAVVGIRLTQDRTAGLTGPKAKIRTVLVAAQVAFAIVLLAAAGLLFQSARNLRNVRPGFEPAGAITFELAAPQNPYDTYEKIRQLYQRVLQDLETVPGVVAVGSATYLPLSGRSGCSLAFVEGFPRRPEEAAPCIATQQATPGYFAALGTAVRGRTPFWTDLDNKSGAVVVTKALADRLWPGEEPIGKGIKGNGPKPPFYRIVGVTEDVRGDGIDKPPLEAVYYPMEPIPGAFLWSPPGQMDVVVRSRGVDARELMTTIRRRVIAIDPTIPISNIRSLEELVAHSMARVTLTMMLLALAGGMALLLSAVGLYGVIAYLVGRRRGEIGVRMALGATGAEVGRQVVRDSVRIAIGGVVIGIGVSLLAMRVLSALLFEVSPSNPLVLGAAAALLLGIAVVASLIPARRATRIDPIEALRAE